MRLYFTRHGESEANTLRIISNRDLPHALTDKGYAQAAGLAEKLKGKYISFIYSSPILRAKQTAEVLSTSLRKPMECVEALREPDCGVLEGRGDKEAWKQHEFWKERWFLGKELNSGPEGGETCVQVEKRLAGFIGALVKRYGKTDFEFVLVTHGALILFGLPKIVTGIDHQTILSRGLDHAVLITTEWLEGSLVLKDWDAGAN